MNKRVFLLLSILAFTLITINTAISYNFEYVNVTSRVNVTNAYPEILSVTINQNIIPNAGTTKIIWCNATIRDWNGYQDINLTNATFWDNATVTMADADNNNTHYTNTSCGLVNGNGYYANYSCAFNVWYYANPSTNWICNVSVKDNYNFTDDMYNITTIQAYYALNVTTPIDFGDMAVSDITNNITANITNFGNADINVSVDGYGAVDGDGLAMVCAIRNISISNLRYSIDGSLWASAIALTDTPQNITGLTVPKRVNQVLWNTTYWDLYVDPSENPFGVCNGTVVFTAWVA